MVSAWRILLPLGAIILVIGIFIASINTMALDLILQNAMVLSPFSQSYPMWKDLPVPLKANFYLWQVDNPDEVQNKGAKPKMSQKGPFSFLEYHHKFEEVWNSNNGTVTYKQKKFWIHQSGDLEQNVTVLNIPYASMGAQVGLLPPLERSMVAFGLVFLKKEDLFVTKTAREILFDGYKDPLLDAGSELKKFGINLPGLTSKFGLFFGRNNTWYADGITNIHTGENGLGELGRVFAVNYSSENSVTNFKGKCRKYQGSADLFPPYLQDKAPGTKELIFNTDLCRTLELTPTGENRKIHGTQGIVYEQSSKFFANSSVNPENWCFDEKNQNPSGLFNASSCRFGAPIFLSQPHFYQADPYYAGFLAENSTNPDKEKHETKFVFEPISAVPLQVAARFQVNIKLDRIKELPAFKNLPEMSYIPFFWSENTMEMPEEMASKMWYLSNLKIIFIAMGAGMIGVGMGLFIYGYFHYMTSVRSERNYRKVNADSGTAQPDEVQSEEPTEVEPNTDNE